ncbi:MAG: hypothetical protein ACYC5Y_13460 [Symbiobacteriia bacterium]
MAIRQERRRRLAVAVAAAMFLVLVGVFFPSRLFARSGGFTPDLQVLKSNAAFQVEVPGYLPDGSHFVGGMIEGVPRFGSSKNERVVMTWGSTGGHLQIVESRGRIEVGGPSQPVQVGSLPGVIEEHAIAAGSQVVALTFTGRRLNYAVTAVGLARDEVLKVAASPSK